MTKIKQNFKANIRLKDIIGQGLINNSNIAIIELIKNARDAKSKNVKVIFENANIKTPKSRIIIQDSGSGMDLEDIINKWLNIAYSEKRNSGGGLFAGDKGIGRFSCDRLGKKLNLYTKKTKKELVWLQVNWLDFEVDDSDKEISSVKLDPMYISENVFKDKTGLSAFSKGTCLIIEDLRETWNKSELEKLRKELERFIIDPEKQFKVYLKSMDFEDENGKFVFDEEIENKLLFKLDEKTISVHSKIMDNGKLIQTEIHHYGDVIFSFEEDNPFLELKNVKAQIHYLSQGSKISFKSITGYSSADYASIMFFFNGFRMMPYGEPKDDWLRLNQKKAQGTRRFLGTRELFGIVEAYDSERRLAPVTSREGMENNLAFKQLTDSDLSDQKYAYLPNILNILQKYVVDGIDWDRAAPKDGSFSVEEITKAIKSVLEAYKKNKKLRNVKIDYKKISRIAEKKVKEYQEFVDHLKKEFSNKAVYDLTSQEKINVKKYVERHEQVLASKVETTKEYKQTLDVEKKRRLFAESHLTSDSQRVRNLEHNIDILNGQVCDNLEEILSAEASTKSLNREEIIAKIKDSFFKACKVRTLAEIIIKANFDMMSECSTDNIFSYFEQYVKDMRENGASFGINVKFENIKNSDLVLNFSPIEASMLVDNVLSNANKAHASNMLIKVLETSKLYSIAFIDDGDGLSEKYKPEDYFNAGITTTRSGAGIGLSHIKQIVEGLEGDVEIFSNKGSGTTLRIWWKK